MSDMQISLQELVIYLIGENGVHLKFDSKYHDLVMELLKEYKAPASLYDMAIELYLGHAEKSAALCKPIRELGMCFDLCPKASLNIVEQVLEQMTVYGLYKKSIQLANRLGRLLSDDQVSNLVNDYVRSGVCSHSTESALIQLSVECGGESLERKTKAAMAPMYQCDAMEII